MKILLTLLLSALFLFNSVGYQVLFGILFLEQHSEMQTVLNETKNEELEKIVVDLLNQKDFFVVNDKEIFYEGRLYDVKLKETNGNQVTYICKKDEKELDLLCHFIKIENENKNGSRKNPVNNFLQKSFQILYFQKLNISGIQLPSIEFCFSTLTFRYNQPDLNLLTPPPQNPSA